MPPVLVPLAGPYGAPALMTKEGVVESVFQLMPSGSRLSARLSGHYRRFAQSKIALPAHITTSEDAERFPIARFTGSIRFPSGTVLITGVGAILGLKIGFWRPGRNMKKLCAPMLVCVCDRDSVAPPAPTLAYAGSSPMCETKRYPYGHFDIYTGVQYEEVTADQVAFLRRVVPIAQARSAPGSLPAGRDARGT
jgi:hypothetical protein